MNINASARSLPSLVENTSAKMEAMEQSLWLIDINDLPGTTGEIHESYSENSQAFEAIVESTDLEYESKERFGTLHRQSSVGDRRKKTKTNVPTKGSNMVRRHSSYSPREYRPNYQHHKEMKTFLESKESKLFASNVVEKLIDFNASLNLVSISDLSTVEESLAMHLSCPVLSYMNEDDEDSVELAAHKKTGLKRRNLASVCEDSEISWETLQDQPSEDPFYSSQEYEIELNTPKEETLNPRAKRRRPRSCLVLAQKLMMQTPQNVVRSYLATS